MRIVDICSQSQSLIGTITYGSNRPRLLLLSKVTQIHASGYIFGYSGFMLLRGEIGMIIRLF